MNSFEMLERCFEHQYNALTDFEIEFLERNSPGVFFRVYNPTLIAYPLWIMTSNNCTIILISLKYE